MRLLRTLGESFTFARDPPEHRVKVGLRKPGQFATLRNAISRISPLVDLIPVLPDVSRIVSNLTGFVSSSSHVVSSSANYSMRARYTHALEAQLAEDAQRLDDYLRGAVAGKVVPLAERRSA